YRAAEDVRRLALGDRHGGRAGHDRSVDRSPTAGSHVSTGVLRRCPCEQHSVPAGRGAPRWALVPRLAGGLPPRRRRLAGLRALPGPTGLHLPALAACERGTQRALFPRESHRTVRLACPPGVPICATPALSSHLEAHWPTLRQRFAKTTEPHQSDSS